MAAEEVDLRAGPPRGVHVHRLGARERTPAARLAFMWRMRRLYERLARKVSFDLVHQLNPVDVGLSLALADVRVPVVLGPYVPDWPDAAGSATARPVPRAASAATWVPVPRAASAATWVRLKRALRGAQQRRATTVLLSTPAAASKLEHRAQRGLHVHELPPGIDERAWIHAAPRGGQDVLFLANLEVRKGVHVALDAFSLLSAELPAARLRLAGSGPETERVRRRIAESPALRRVELLGHVDHDRVMAAMHACDVYCLPSFGEPFGMAALEAMACGRPVVVSEAGGLRHLVPAEGGRKVPPGDAAALAAALRELLADPGLREAMGRHNRSVVERRYAWRRVVDRLEDVYREAVAAPRAGGRRPAARRRNS